MNKISYMTFEEYSLITRKLEGGHWNKENYLKRWHYHSITIELIKTLNIKSGKNILEMGTMGVSCVKNSDTFDFGKQWDFPERDPTYLHDAKVLPWPIKDKAYEVFVALRVFQHLAPLQQECLKEALRISKKIIIVIPDNYRSKIFPNSEGISYSDFVDFLDGIHPNLFLPTALGNLYYWDTENPSSFNLAPIINKTKFIEYKNISIKRMMKKTIKSIYFLNKLNSRYI